MTDLSKLWGQAKAADAGSGFARHPVGRFQGHIVDIVERDYQGKPIYELMIETEVGKAKHSVWDLGQDDLDKIGEEKFLEQLARRKRLVVDLGQKEPGTYDQWLEALGQTVGSACTLVVQEDKKKPGEVVTFINAPEGAEAAPATKAAAKKSVRKPGY